MRIETVSITKQIKSDNKSRKAIILAGLKLFSKEGFDAISNRMIAAEADSNQSLIGYHFGSKHGLYLAVFEHIADDIGGQVKHHILEIEPTTTALLNKLKEGSDFDKRDFKTATIDLVVQLMNVFADIILKPSVGNYAKLIVREQLNPTEAFDVLWNGGMKVLLEQLTQLIAISKERVEPDETDKLLCLTILGQLVYFRSARAEVNNYMRWNEPHSDEIVQSIKVAIESNIRLLLNCGTSKA